jgi:hypothetical protein
LRVRELSPRIKLPKFIQDSGIRGGRRGIPKIETYIAEAGSGIFLGDGGDKSGEFGVLGREIILTAGLLVRNQVELWGQPQTVKTGMCLECILRAEKDVAIRILVAQKTVQSF